MWREAEHPPDRSQNDRPPLGGLFHSARYARLRSTTRPAADSRRNRTLMRNQTQKGTYKGWQERFTLGMDEKNNSVGVESNPPSVHPDAVPQSLAQILV